jgi:type I restriction enzyme S subunit
MSSDWPTKTLADLSLDVSYGYTESAQTEPVGPRFLRITDIQNGVVDWPSVPYCTIDSRRLPNYLLQRGDIVVARTGNSTGENYIFDSPEHAVFASYLIRFRINHSQANPLFVWYQLRTQRWWDFVAGSRTGSAQAGANAQVLGRFEITLPSRHVQDRIAEQLNRIDNKININRRINKTLEGMAQAIFKSWFVDFDPVKAKIAAKQAGSDPLCAAMSTISGKPAVQLDAMQPDYYEQLAATAALFPDEMEESTLGEIPKEWAVDRVGKVLELVYGKALKSTDRQEGTVPVYGSGGITGYHNTPLVPHGSIIVGRKGTVGSLYWEDEPFFPIDTTYYVRPISVPLTYCYYAMQTLGLGGMNTDAAVPGLNRENVYRLELIRPDPSILKRFDAEVSTMRKAIRVNAESNKALANLRDTLLPKLLSGELPVADANAEIEA